MQDVTLLLEAHRALGTSLFYLGELVPGRAHLEQAITLYDPQQHRSWPFAWGRTPEWFAEALPLGLLGCLVIQTRPGSGATTPIPWLRS